MMMHGQTQIKLYESLTNLNVCLALVFWEGNNLRNVQCNLLKQKLQENPVSSFQTVM